MSKILIIDFMEKELFTYLLEIKKNGYEVKESKRYPLSDRYDFSLDVVTEDIESAYLSLPVSSLNFRFIDLPFSDKERIREILPFELDGLILGGSNEVIFDDAVIGSSGNKYQVLAVYIEKNILRELLEKLKLYRIDPVSIISIELREVLKDFTSERLLSPVMLEDKDRIALAFEEIKKPTINLRRDEFSYTRDVERTRKSLKVTAVLMILLVLVLAADLLLRIVTVRHEIVFLKNEMRKRYQEVFPGEKNIVNELYQLKSHMKELKGKEELYVGVNPLNLLLNLSQIDKQGIVFNEVTADRVNLIMKGEAPSLSDIQHVRGKLESFFNEVTISDSKSSSQGTMLFTITAKERKA
jgi:type II secretory pathway component PulL